MADIEGRLLAMLAELRSTEGIEVYHATEGPLATWLTGPEHALDVIRKADGIPLAPELFDDFHRHDELHCYWRGAGSDSTIGGEFWLTHLVNVAVGHVPAELPDTVWPLGARGDYGAVCDVSEVYGPDEEERVLHGFDGQGLTGNGALAGFTVSDDDECATLEGTPGHPEIWFSVNTDGTLVRLDLTYTEYLETLLLTRGLHGWQYLYAAPDDPGFGHYGTDLGPRLDFLERTFPDDDFSPLRARWELHRAHDEPRLWSPA